MSSVKEFKQMSAMCCDLFKIELNLGKLEGEEDFPGGLVVENQPAIQEMQAWALGQEDPLEKEMATHFSLFFPGKSHGQKNLSGYSPGGCKSQTRLSNKKTTKGGELENGFLSTSSINILYITYIIRRLREEYEF